MYYVIGVLIVVIVVLGMIKIVGTKRKLGVHMQVKHCPECGEPFPRVRKPANFRQAMWGGSTCQNCGCEVDRAGNKV